MNPDSIIIPTACSTRYFFKRQGWHLVILLLLIAVSWWIASPVLGDGEYGGVLDTNWYWLAIRLVIIQQALGWLVFRAQLGSALLSRWFGSRDIAVWGILFTPLLIARPILLIFLGLADRDSLGLSSHLSVALGLLALIPGIYTLWSVGKHFGLVRALGGDHFRITYRELPLVREGAFRWSDNAIYAYAFLVLWSIALILNSRAALSLVLFQHAYVWVHYYCTEEPDMHLIYDIET